MFRIEFGRVTLAREVQLEKQESDSFVKEDGSSIFISPEYAKATLPIDTSVLGKVTCCKELQDWKARPPIDKRPSGRFTDKRLSQS